MMEQLFLESAIFIVHVALRLRLNLMEGSVFGFAQNRAPKIGAHLPCGRRFYMKSGFLQPIS